MNETSALSIRNLGVAFHRFGQTVMALDGIDLTVPQGQWVMVTGHNGSGKSSLLRAVAGQVDATAGTINRPSFGGEADGFSSDCFFVTQDPLAGTADALSLLENLVVADPLLGRSNTRSATRHVVYNELLSSVGLHERRHQLLRYFSGGERQQIALLIAQLRRPSLLLLDEPFSALDPVRAASCLRLVSAVHDQRATILQVTHDADHASTLGDRTITLDGGRLCSDSTRAKRGADATTVMDEKRVQ